MPIIRQPSKKQTSLLQPGAKEEKAPAKPTKKSRILKSFEKGERNLQKLAEKTNSQLSYVASVLQSAGLIEGYFDLYTHTSQKMNVYTPLLGGKLGFRNEEVAKSSVALLDRVYEDLQNRGDRAGQHHVLVTALTMLDRARWSGKEAEAEIFRRWLTSRLI